uniref:Ammonium transporter AmtB-like domain-containing protein n=1 Tax=Populus alba TaxID=43335 RepID=A0A4U5R2H0_POPAL|nr:hypothetical protein D5086_0000008210 [Populus alba]
MAKSRHITASTRATFAHCFHLYVYIRSNAHRHNLLKTKYHHTLCASKSNTTTCQSAYRRRKASVQDKAQPIWQNFQSTLLPDEASPAWMNKGDSAWLLTAATLVGLQSVPGLVIRYGSSLGGTGGTKDRERFPPDNVTLMLAGAGLLWMGWSGFNGGDPYTVSTDTSLAVLNTHVCTATSLLTWLLLDILFFGKPLCHWSHTRHDHWSSLYHPCCR